MWQPCLMFEICSSMNSFFLRVTISWGVFTPFRFFQVNICTLLNIVVFLPHDGMLKFFLVFWVLHAAQFADDECSCDLIAAAFSFFFFSF